MEYLSTQEWDQFNQHLSDLFGVDYKPMDPPTGLLDNTITNHVPWNAGKTGLQPSTRKGTKQKPLTPEHREKIRQSMLATTNSMEDPANRAKISAKLKGRVFSDEWKAKLKASSAKRWGKT